MNRNTKIIIMVLAVLIIATGISVAFNQQNAAERRALLEAAQIAVLDGGVEIARLDMKTLNQLYAVEFTARLKSSIMKKPEEHIYTGAALSQLFTAVGVSLEGKNRVIVHSADGYAVPLGIEEIEELDNIYLVYKDNGKHLGSYQEVGGQGPYMIVIRGDRFSQRWAKYVVELDIQ